ncbi:MAG: hypothetical protein P9M02_02630 [Candidatus Susulua stagnicola]|nr:hypothetical protein [Candidatus Susulua stagnicola]
MVQNSKNLLRKAKQRAIHQNLAKWTASTRIHVGMSTCEIAAGSKVVKEVLEKPLKPSSLLKIVEKLFKRAR